MNQESINPLDGILVSVGLVFLLYGAWNVAIFVFDSSIKMLRWSALFLIAAAFFYFACFVILNINIDVGPLRATQSIITGSYPWRIIQNIAIPVSDLVPRVLNVFNYFK